MPKKRFDADRGPHSPLAMVVLTVLVLPALAGCAGNETAASGGTGADDDNGHAADAVHIDVEDLKFQPETRTVEAGTTVTWENHDSVMHTATPTDEDAWGTSGSGEMQEGASWSFTFTEPGTYDYYCEPHAYQDDEGTWKGMTGTIVVEAE